MVVGSPIKLARLLSAAGVGAGAFLYAVPTFHWLTMDNHALGVAVRLGLGVLCFYFCAIMLLTIMLSELIHDFGARLCYLYASIIGYATLTFHNQRNYASIMLA